MCSYGLLQTRAIFPSNLKASIAVGTAHHDYYQCIIHMLGKNKLLKGGEKYPSILSQWISGLLISLLLQPMFLPLPCRLFLYFFLYFIIFYAICYDPSLCVLQKLCLCRYTLKYRNETAHLVKYVITYPGRRTTFTHSQQSCVQQRHYLTLSGTEKYLPGTFTPKSDIWSISS